MTDELECFRRAALVGSNDFVIRNDHVLFMDMEIHAHRLPAIENDAEDNARVNRYAGAVCSLFFMQPHLQTLERRLEWAGRARNFARKYGSISIDESTGTARPMIIPLEGKQFEIVCGNVRAKVHVERVYMRGKSFVIELESEPHNLPARI